MGNIELGSAHSNSVEHRIQCEACRSGAALDFDFSMAFQPIVDVRDRSVYAYEALVRGTNGAGAASILERVTVDNRYRFDQACRAKAVETREEYAWLRGIGLALFQGYHFAHPGLEHLPEVDWSTVDDAALP